MPAPWRYGGTGSQNEAIDTPDSLVTHCAKRALGRLPSAARELAPTHFGSFHGHEPSSGPDQADSGHHGRKVCMPREITSATSLENLRKEAKRWLKALRAGDAGARARLDRAYPGAPRDPVLRDVQHALAREYGQENW